MKMSWLISDGNGVQYDTKVCQTMDQICLCRWTYPSICISACKYDEYDFFFKAKKNKQRWMISPFPPESSCLNDLKWIPQQIPSTGPAKCHSDNLTPAWNPGTLTDAARIAKKVNFSSHLFPSLYLIYSPIINETDISNIYQQSTGERSHMSGRKRKGGGTEMPNQNTHTYTQWQKDTHYIKMC